MGIYFGKIPKEKEETYYTERICNNCGNEQLFEQECKKKINKKIISIKCEKCKCKNTFNIKYFNQKEENNNMSAIIATTHTMT